MRAQFRMIVWLVTLTACSILWIGAPVRAQTPPVEAPATMLLIDGSGSMWARFEADKRAKIDAVRERLTSVVQTAGPGAIGVTSFGHRRRGDCSDVEVVVSLDDSATPAQSDAAPAPETGDGAAPAAAPSAAHAATLAAIAKLDPRGKGPLAAGLRAAMAAIGTRRPASIIAISDGVDNCQQDACVTASELAQTFPGIAVHTVAVGVDRALQAKLSCVAAATGGTFLAANDSAEVDTAIDKAAQLAMLSREAAAPSNVAAPAARKTLPGGDTLSAKLSLTNDGKPLSVPAHWRIFSPGATSPLAERDASELSWRLEPGSYDIEARIDRASVRQTITIEPDAATIVVLPLNAAHLKVVARSASGVEPTTSSIIQLVSSSPAGAEQPAMTTIVQHGPLDVFVPPGDYTVSVRSGVAQKTEQLSLAAGTEKTLDMVLQSGSLELTAGASENSPPIDDVVFAIQADDPESATGRRDVARSRAVPARLTLPAGTYYVSAQSALGEVRQRIAVGAGEVVRQRLILPLAPVTVSARIAGHAATASHGLVYRIAELDGEKREILRSLRPSLAVKLSPGRYRVSAHLDAHHIVSSQDVAIDGASPVDIVIDVAAAEITLQSDAARSGDVQWDVRDSADRPVWHTAATEPKLLLAPGRYTVHLDTREGRKSAAFEVNSGEQRLIQLGSAAMP